MKLRDVTKQAGTAHLHVWPPQVLVGSGTMFLRPREGVLKSMRRIGDRLSLTIEHEGREAMSGIELETDQRPMLDAIEKLLKTCIGRSVREIGDLDV